MFSKIFVLGRMTRDPEFDISKSGTPICKFSLAVNKKINGKETATFFNCIAFKKTAEIVNQYAKKGLQVLVEGELQQRDYEKDGQKKIWTEIVVASVNVFGRELKHEDHAILNNQPQEIVGAEYVDDNIPF